MYVQIWSESESEINSLLSDMIQLEDCRSQLRVQLRAAWANTIWNLNFFSKITNSVMQSSNTQHSLWLFIYYIHDKINSNFSRSTDSSYFTLKANVKNKKDCIRIPLIFVISKIWFRIISYLATFQLICIDMFVFEWEWGVIYIVALPWRVELWTW